MSLQHHDSDKVTITSNTIMTESSISLHAATCVYIWGLYVRVVSIYEKVRCKLFGKIELDPPEHRI